MIKSAFDFIRAAVTAPALIVMLYLAKLLDWCENWFDKNSHKIIATCVAVMGLLIILLLTTMIWVSFHLLLEVLRGLGIF